MTLATHALVGASLAQLFPEHPVVGFCVGFASHFFLDAIPHWDYKLASSRQDIERPLESDIVVGRDFYFDLLKIGTDALLGLVLAFVFFPEFTFPAVLLTIAGAFGGILPDALQFAYFKLRVEPLVSLQRFHKYMHAKLHLRAYPLPGATLQAIFAIIVVYIVKMIGLWK